MKITIITIVKNDKLNISKTIKSVLNQSFKNYEYIICDGLSTDGTDEEIRRNIKNTKVLYYRKKDKNFYDGLNSAIKKAKGIYIVILNSGDLFYEKNTLKNISKYLNFYDVISGNIVFKKKKLITRNWNYHIKNPNKYNCFKIPHTSMFIKKKIIKKVGKYNTNYRISSDTDFILRIFKKKISFKYIPKNLVVMQHGGLSTSFNYLYQKILEDLKIYFEHFSYLFIIIYFHKIIYKIYKLMLWKFFKK